MTDIHAIISKATIDLIDLTGYEKAVDIQSVLYMNLSGYTAGGRVYGGSRGRGQAGRGCWRAG